MQPFCHPAILLHTLEVLKVKTCMMVSGYEWLRVATPVTRLGGVFAWESLHLPASIKPPSPASPFLPRFLFLYAVRT